MVRLMVFLLSLGLFFINPITAQAGKVEEVQRAMMSACSKDISSADALRLMKPLFISCTPGQKMDIEGCRVVCLKSNAGSVIGQ